MLHLIALTALSYLTVLASSHQDQLQLALVIGKQAQTRKTRKI
jgi:hypothetical protein